jgi:acetate kinase
MVRISRRFETGSGACEMKILALNFGSSSIKYKLFDASNNYQLLMKGGVDRIGQRSSSIYRAVGNQQEERMERFLEDHRTAMHALYQEWTRSQQKDDAIGSIDAVGHRIVHGGERLRHSILINEEVIKEIKELARFAPLHCEPNIIGIEVAKKLLPDVPHVAVFDTAAYAAMEPKAYLYGIPIEYHERYHIRKYGFHGINHHYVANEAAKILNKSLKDLRVITCHLGSGCSISPFEKGRAIDNSMGLTPLEGLVMSSRCGDLDPSAVLYFMDVLGLSSSEVTDLLNKQSGLLGLCGKSDMRDIIPMAEKGDRRSQLAIDVFVYRIQKSIGAFIAVLNGVDVIVFTGGIGENSSYLRARIMDHFRYIGIALDEVKNKENQTLFSSDHANVLLMRIPANEELVIAQETEFVYQERLR